MKNLKLIALLILFVTISVSAEETAGGKLSGYMFGDYYYYMANHNKEIEHQNGLTFRRIYFQYDYKFNEAFSTRLRLEMANPDGVNGEADKMYPVVKDAYVQYKTGNHKVYLGLVSVPTWGLVEKSWGYRSIEKTPLDLQKMGSSRDMGIGMKGKLVNSGLFTYNVMFGNGNSNKSENNKGKKFMGALGINPIKGLKLELYADYYDVKTGEHWDTYQVFATYATARFTLGAQYAIQTRTYGEGDDETTTDLNLASFFVRGKITDNIKAFARVDKMLEPNPKGADISYIPFDPTAKSTFITAGIDFEVYKNIHLMPNVEFVSYEENEAGVTPDSDIIPRLTFYYKFK